MSNEINNFKSITSVTEFNEFLNQTWDPQIGKNGGRTFSNGQQNFKLNCAVKKLRQLAKNNPAEIQEIGLAAKQLRTLGRKKVKHKNILLKFSTQTRQFFGNLTCNREKILYRLQFPESKLVTSNEDYRYLALRGTTGTVACRVYGKHAKTIPRLYEEGIIGCATHSYGQMRNLIAVRGEREGARMIGPCDYYGNLGKTHKYQYTIDIQDGVPAFFKHEKKASLDQSIGKSTDFTGKTASIAATWHSGKSNQISEIKKKYEREGQQAFGGSLFLNSGILEINQSKVELPAFDATQFDLSPFKARLVKNDIPFQIIEEKVSFLDYFCPVTYLFEPEYAKDQVEHGGGLFLETHDFSQTMTPLDESPGGFITLGRWKDKDNLELIGVKIPYGYTLIIGKDCIHGDTTLKGTYMMAMTSCHVTMQTANTVFLKDRNTFKNFDMVMQEDSVDAKSQAVPPVAYFGQKDAEVFNNELNDHWKFYNPFKRILNPFANKKR